METAINANGPSDPAGSAPTGAVKALLAPAQLAKSKPGVPTLRSAKINRRRHTVVVAFAGRGSTSGFQCALERVGTARHVRAPKPRYRACKSPKRLEKLGRASYTLLVRARGPGGLSAPLAFRFKMAPPRQSTRHRR